MRFAFVILMAGLMADSLLADAVCAAEIPQAERRSGYSFMTPDTKAMQDDDTANPGMLWVLDGEGLWKRKLGTACKACADCHDDARTSMKGVAARYPALVKGKTVNLEQRINACRVEKQRAKPWPYESRELLAMTAYVGNQSRGMPIAVDAQKNSKSFEAGRAIYFQRQGQLNLSCAQCHDERANGKLGGAPIPQAHPTGYPIYRLEWQAMGSLQRRLRNCISGMRAEPYELGAPELVALELYLMSRAAGMKMETPAVRP